MEENETHHNTSNDILGIAMELKAELDEFRKAVQQALDQRKESFRNKNDIMSSDRLVLSSIGRRKYIIGGNKKLPVRIREPTWITSREATDLMRISARTLSRYREKRYITFKMVNGAYRYRYEELKTFTGITKPNNH